MKRKFEDKIIKIIDKIKFSPRVFSTILVNFTEFKILILNNNKKIDISEITDGYSYVNSCITKYESMIVKYNTERKPTKLFHEELEKNKKLLIEYENRLIKVLDKELPFIKEIITNHGTHILINNKMFHSLDGPSIYNDDWSIQKTYYFINDENIEENEWKRSPYVREHRIRNIIKKIDKNRNKRIRPTI